MSNKAAFIVVGAGQAAARAATAMRTGGFDGDIILLGAEAHLPYERPLLSKALLLDAQTPIPFVVPQATYVELDIEVRTRCVVTSINRTERSVQLSDGSGLHYDRLLIATGSRVRPLHIEGLASDAVISLRTLDDCRRLAAQLHARPTVAVIGGGFIGLEVAATAAKLGCRVTVVEAAARLLPRLACPEASRAVLAHHQSRGVDVRLGSGVVGGAGGRLRLKSGDEIAADIILAGVGVSPETSLAAAAGLQVNDGVVVDCYGLTSDPLIYAAGDVARRFNPLLGRAVRFESWQNANLQAEAVGRTMAGCPTLNDEIPWLWSDQGDLNLQMAGAPSAVDRTIVRGELEGPDGITIFQFDGERLVGGVTVNRGKDMTILRRLLAQDRLAMPAEALANPNVPLRQFTLARHAA